MRTPPLPLRRLVPSLLLAAGCALALSGCIRLGSGKPPATLLTLTSASAVAAGAGASGKAEDALVVFDPEVDRTLAVQRVAVTVDPANVAYLKDALWVERPARLFGALLTETIRAKGKRLVFAADDRAAAGSDRLSGRLLALGYDAASQAVVVRFDAVRTRPGGAIATRRFESRVPVSRAEAATVAPALNRAANAVAAEVADWIG
ncbi:ABC-type transport auxiliary lipoprotein family protein [Novosphingobium piscinae]|uniref:Membrane integrity-associated transporter subunit PqiC n=1 Tax=Novosphingobium piscinae TaxID=1507448 RepID=A0A7X1KRB3_9SPHN|nr:ABC-type transport auxiliary lipoprotein family protein [Novosphingobium piscinae]MBC2670440.1 membrane integrity-associated transporter subunit PqiC [Novosphingobium piscinae]